MLPQNLESQKIKTLVSLKSYNTWKIGGLAEFLTEPKSINELSSVITWSKRQNIPCHIIGAGSNLLINDNELKGLTICMRKMNGCKIDPITGIVEVFSGEPIPNLARKVGRQGLHGLEWAIGIPGTIGGATVMNAGAQGGCIADCLISVKAISLDQGHILKIKRNDLNYSYRKSILQNEKLIVVSACFHFDPGHDKNKINKLTNQNLLHRLTTQPYQIPSCGSVFQNPQDHKAGQIIQDLGLKGLRIGGAEISSLHANFIVNTNNATAKDILDLIKIVQERVQKKHGFLLHTEVKRLGFNEIS